MRKKFIGVMLAAAMAAGLAGCGRHKHGRSGS